jgi:hypothetical protein
MKDALDLSFPRKVVTPVKTGAGIHSTDMAMDSCFRRVRV